MKRFNNILCVVEPNANSEAALEQAIRIAKDHQASMTIATTLRTGGALKSIFKNQSERDQVLSESANKKRNATDSWVRQYQPELSVEVDVYAGIGFIEIVKSVAKHQYDLVVKCADDVDWLDRLFGSDDMHLLRKCPCPVLMLKPGHKEVFKSVLATVDVNDDFDELDRSHIQDELNEAVLEYSAAFSLAELTELHIGSAWEAYGEDFLRYGAFAHMSDENADSYEKEAQRACADRLEFLMTVLTKQLGKDTLNFLRPKVHLVKGRPAQEIPLMAAAYDVDLIVMGTVARTGIPGFIIGNTAEYILGQVQCSVLAIKPEGFESPILSAQ